MPNEPNRAGQVVPMGVLAYEAGQITTTCANRRAPARQPIYRSHQLSTRIARRVTHTDALPGPSSTSNQTRPGMLQSTSQVPSASRFDRTRSIASPSLASGAESVRIAAERK